MLLSEGQGGGGGEGGEARKMAKQTLAISAKRIKIT